MTNMKACIQEIKLRDEKIRQREFLITSTTILLSLFVFFIVKKETDHIWINFLEVNIIE